MARPIAETPILTGADAVRFEERMRWVDSLTLEQRKENLRKLEESCKEAEKFIKICF